MIITHAPQEGGAAGGDGEEECVGQGPEGAKSLYTYIYIYICVYSHYMWIHIYIYIYYYDIGGY